MRLLLMEMKDAREVVMDDARKVEMEMKTQVQTEMENVISGDAVEIEDTGLSVQVNLTETNMDGDTIEAGGVVVDGGEDAAVSCITDKVWCCSLFFLQLSFLLYCNAFSKT